MYIVNITINFTFFFDRIYLIVDVTDNALVVTFVFINAKKFNFLLKEGGGGVESRQFSNV